MKGRWDLDKWLPLFHQSDRRPSICSNLNDNKILNCFVLEGQFLCDKHPSKVTLFCNLDSCCLFGHCRCTRLRNNNHRLVKNITPAVKTIQVNLSLLCMWALNVKIYLVFNTRNTNYFTERKNNGATVPNQT